MLSISALETLRESYSVYSPLTVAEAWQRIGNPSVAELIDFAVAQMAQPDRNTRVLLLRVLRHQQGEAAMRGVLLGLNDAQRRVCAVAIQACPNYLEYEAIAKRLEAIARDSNRKRKLRRRALSMLAGDEGRLPGDLTAAAAAALTRLLPEAQYRWHIVFGLARLDLAPRSERLLLEFAASPEQRERALARRALISGERVVHLDWFAADRAFQQAIMTNCEIAHGRMYYWLPRASLPAQMKPAS